jgi:UDP-2,3-diacylglucosamine hydrolase
MECINGKRIYFLSDFHLGAPDDEASRKREQRIVAFLEKARKDASGIFLLGDAFDFWYEYRTVVPKGYVRLLGKLAELTDSGIPIHFFAGNHDMWMRDYFQKELSIPVFFEPRTYLLNGRKFLIGHGDGLGPGDHGYKFLKKIFRNPICQFLFGVIPPYLGMGIAQYFSKRSRAVTGENEGRFLGEDKEWLLLYGREVLKTQSFDYLVFGHRHLPIDHRMSEQCRYINLGDWIRYYTYGYFDGNEFQLCALEPSGEAAIYRG